MFTQWHRTVMWVDNIHFTHDSICPRFGDGRPFDDLIRRIVDEPESPLDQEELELEVILLHNRHHSLNNRRLHCLKEAQKLRMDPLKVHVQIFVMGAFFEKVWRSMTTENGGRTVRVRDR